MDCRVRDIKAGDLLVAQVFNFDSPGPVVFPTPASAEMQCGFGEATEYNVIKPHLHNIVDRQTHNTSEFIYVILGKMDLVFLDLKGQPIGEATIMPGHGFLQYIGGHKITIFAGTRYFELKQGPYFGLVKDKTILDE